jgi:trehalose synthase
VASATVARLSGRVVWNVNSTAKGGGVAEMLQALLPYVRGAGIDARWVVMRGSDDFFAVTKRLHHALHGSEGDGSALGQNAHAIYDRATRDNVATYLDKVSADDIVVLHDPQTAGLAPYLIDKGAMVIWRCHIGKDSADPEVSRGWQFLSRYLRDVPAFVFTREAYVPDYCDHGKSVIITPSIDAFSPKNQEMGEAAVRAILVHAGIVDAAGGEGSPEFVREDGTRGIVGLRAKVVREAGLDWSTPLVVQVSRWDPLKDPVGVMRGFVRLVEAGDESGAALVLAGPDASAVADDPEGAEVYDSVVAERSGLPQALRRRVHLVSLPMTDVQENAAIVNALQRHAAVIVQKSLMEGFGLTVTEAMWKARPVVASPVGGILDQIVDGHHGMLLKHPGDTGGLAVCLGRLLNDPVLARRLGEAARQRAATEFLGIQHLAKYAALIERLLGEREQAGDPGRFTAADRLLERSYHHRNVS